MHKLLFFGGSVAIVVASVCLWPRVQGDVVAHDEPQTDAVDALAILQTRVRVLELHVKDVTGRCAENQFAARAMAPLGRVAEQQPAPPRLLPSTDEPPEPPEPSARLKEDFADRLRTETLDPVESRRTQHELSEQLSTSSPQTHLESVDCTTTMCRFVMKHDTPEAQHAIDASLAELAIIKGGVSYDYDESSDPPVTTAYAVREP